MEIKVEFLNFKCSGTLRRFTIKPSLFLTILVTVVSSINTVLYSQVGINLSSGEEPLALLDIRATNPEAPSKIDGFLLPKVDQFPDADIYGLVEGTLVYFTGSLEGRQTNSIYVYTELEAWELLSQSGDGIDDDGDALQESQGENRMTTAPKKTVLRRVGSTSAQNLQVFPPRL